MKRRQSRVSAIANDALKARHRITAGCDVDSDIVVISVANYNAETIHTLEFEQNIPEAKKQQII